MSISKEQIFTLLDDKCQRHFGCYLKEATNTQVFKATCLVVRDMLAKKRQTFCDQYEGKKAKQVYYISMEFLVGTSLHNNLFNLGLEDVFRDALKEVKVDLKDLYAMEPDAGLGNGGLGRLASCYMDSATTLSIPCTGFSIRYVVLWAR